MPKIIRILVFVIIIMLVVYLSGMGSSSSSIVASNTGGKHLGFWIDERDIWGGSGTNWSPQQFVQNYFLTAPYPSAMYFSFGTESPYASVRDPWISQVCQLASAYPNIKMMFHAFANLSSSSDVQELNNFYSGVKGCSAAYAADLDYEYYNANNLLQAQQQYASIVNSYGLAFLAEPSQSSNFPSDPVLGYSEYPYYTGTLVTNQPSQYMGVGYGEIGCWNPNLWTQSVITNIIEHSFANPYVLIYSELGACGTYAGIDSLWNPLYALGAEERGWIWNDPSYSTNFVLSTDPSSKSTTLSTSSSTLGSSSTTSLTTSQSSYTSTSISSPSTSSTTASTSLSTTFSSSSSSSSTMISSTTGTTSTSSTSSSAISTSSSSSSQVSTKTSSTLSSSITSSQNTSMSSNSLRSSSSSSQSRNLQTSTNSTTTHSPFSSSTINSNSQSHPSSSQALAPSNSVINSNQLAMSLGFAGYEIALIVGIPFMSWAVRKGEFDAAKIAKAWRW